MGLSNAENLKNRHTIASLFCLTDIRYLFNTQRPKMVRHKTIKSCSKCYKIFRMRPNILGSYAFKG